MGPLGENDQWRQRKLLAHSKTFGGGNSWHMFAMFIAIYSARPLPFLIVCVSVCHTYEPFLFFFYSYFALFRSRRSGRQIKKNPRIKTRFGNSAGEDFDHFSFIASVFFPLTLPHSLPSVSLSLQPRQTHFVSPCASVSYVAACASDLNSQQGFVGRDSRCEGSLWLRESWRSNTVMIRTTGWHRKMAARGWKAAWGKLGAVCRVYAADASQSLQFTPQSARVSETQRMEAHITW